MRVQIERCELIRIKKGNYCLPNSKTNAPGKLLCTYCVVNKICDFFISTAGIFTFCCRQAQVFLPGNYTSIRYFLYTNDHFLQLLF